ncbi:hypothetical protein CR513_11089, partial [Mucuna pruriens]
MAQFLHGLNREVHDVVELQHYKNLSELVHQANKVSHLREFVFYDYRLGSCVNVASERLIKKLALPTIVYPRSYRLQWLSEKRDLLVDKQAQVTFFLGAYEDRVMCDVVPMQATHLLLGRPWQFDK